MIKPDNRCVLVELQGSYKHVSTPDARVETKKQGICVSLSDELQLEKYKKDNWLNKTVYFDEFEDVTNYDVDGKKYALIDAKNIKGHDE